MARGRVNEHRRTCAALAAAWYRLRVMPNAEILASVGFTAADYYQDPIVASSTGMVARDAFRAKWKPKETPTRFELEERERIEELDEEVRHVNREPTDGELEALEEPTHVQLEERRRAVRAFELEHGALTGTERARARRLLG